MFFSPRFVFVVRGCYGLLRAWESILPTSSDARETASWSWIRGANSLETICIRDVSSSSPTLRESTSDRADTHTSSLKFGLHGSYHYHHRPGSGSLIAKQRGVWTKAWDSDLGLSLRGLVVLSASVFGANTDTRCSVPFVSSPRKSDREPSTQYSCLAPFERARFSRPYSFRRLGPSASQ